MIPQTVLNAVNRGWSVIPCRADKRPAIHSWKPYQERRPTDDEIRAWVEAGPACWAVVTGAISGVIILDFDGEAGRQTLEKLGLTPHVKTPSGGFHLYVTHPGWHITTVTKQKKALARAFPGMDVKGDGGYAIFYGSTDEGTYEWL